jgi:hypothetical protein
MMQKITPSLMASQILSVQPMSGPTSINPFQSLGRGMRQIKSFSIPRCKQIIGPPGKNGKPHWRARRLLEWDESYVEIWKNIQEEWFQAKKEYEMNAVMKRLIDHTIKTPAFPEMGVWVAQNTIGARKVFDQVYNNNGIHFDTEEQLVQFILTWTQRC